MYKKKKHLFRRAWLCTKKYVMIMKLSVLILLLSVMQVGAVTVSMGQTLSFDGTKENYSALFRAIRKQTGYNVLLKSTHFDLNRRVNQLFDSSSLEEVLQFLEKEESLSYAYEGKTIILVPRSLTLEVRNPHVSTGTTFCLLRHRTIHLVLFLLDQLN